MKEKIARLIALLPDEPGVYLMKDENDQIIYIGKAKNLKKRVSQYFLRPQVGKVAAMVSHVDHFEFIVVHEEKEAFILEMNLIQTHYPRYNIVLKDDSHYPYIALKRSDATLSIARRVTKRNEYYYFGPFPNSGDCYKTIDLLNSIYPTRKCHALPSKPCLYYHLGQCLAPCIRKVEDEEYRKMYESIRRFLEGDVSEVLAKLKEKMLEASAEERYEDAQSYKEKIEAIKQTTSHQAVEAVTDFTSRDVVAYAEREGYLALSLLSYRGGRLLGKRSEVVASFGDSNEQITELLEQYYQKEEYPAELAILLPHFKEEFSLIYPSIRVIEPKEGRIKQQLDIALLNARKALDHHFMSARLEEDNEALLEELGKMLSLPFPKRIELFDNSHLQGASPVGAMVCFINGERVKGMYRKFHLSEEDAGDDYHSMQEIIERRYLRLKEEKQEYPNLILVDGGLTQVHAALEALKAIDVTIPVFGLYKNNRHETEGIIDKEGKQYPLDRKSPLFFLLMRMQDEVHRFAITFHRQERSKSMTNSLFDNIKGIGPKRRELLRKHYPTLESIQSATLEELSQILPEELALEVMKKVSQ